MKKARILASSLTLLSFAFCMASPVSDTSAPVNHFTIVSSMETDAAGGRLYYQNAKNWSSDLRGTGCGLFAMANSVYALNGKKMDMSALADWAKKNRYWTSTGTKRALFYSNVTGKFGEKYGFNVDSMYDGSVTDKRLINHLKNGGVAIAHVGTPRINGHFIAITGYSNGKYHVIDSVGRCAGSTGDAWRTAEYLSDISNHNYRRVDWFALISNRTFSDVISKTVKSVADTAEKTMAEISGSKKYFPRYRGSSSSITEALKAVGSDSSFEYRKKIAVANGCSNYSGTAAQNSSMLKQLKAGTLIKP